MQKVKEIISRKRQTNYKRWGRKEKKQMREGNLHKTERQNRMQGEELKKKGTVS